MDVSVIMRRDAGTGIQRVVRSVWAHLSTLETAEFDVVPVYAGSTHGYCFAQQGLVTRLGTNPRAHPVGARRGDKFLGLDLSAHYLPDCGEQLAAWREAGASIHCLVYDLLPLSRPDWFEEPTCYHFRRWLRTLTEHADQALCISGSVAQDLQRQIAGTTSNRLPAIGRIVLSGDIAGSLPTAGFSPVVEAALERAKSRPPILMIGTVEPRKAYDRALDAFERLWGSEGRSAPDLVIIGKAGWKTNLLQDRIRNHPQHGSRLHWLTDVSDEALMRFYESSAGVLLASYDEGFGLPLIEAATHRRWALARNLPVFQEQRLPNVSYFSDDSPNALADAVLGLIRRAEAAPPPAAALPQWRWCVDRLLEQIGFHGQTAVRELPKLRSVS